MQPAWHRGRAASSAAPSSRGYWLGLLSRCCAARDVLACLVHPAVRLWIADEVEEPSEKGESIATSQPEPCCVRGKGIGKCAWILVRASNSVGDDVRHRVGFLTIVEEIRCDARGTGHG